MLSTNRERVIDLFAEQLDDIHVAAKAIRESHLLLTARASALDNIGASLSIERRVEQTDSNFRFLLESLINIYASAGTKFAITTFLSAYLDIEISIIRIFELYPGSITIYLPADFSDDEEKITEVLEQVLAAGISVDFVWATTYWDDPESKWDTDDYWV